MLSSYSVIKNTSVAKGEAKKITTSYDLKENEYLETETDLPVEEQERMIQSYKDLAQSILTNAQAKRDEIMRTAYINAEKLEREAYEKGYSQGQQNGYEDGYKESYEKHMEAVRQEEKQIEDNLNQMLFQAKLQYEEYLKEKEREIVKLAVEMAEKVVKQKLTEDFGLNNIIEEILVESKNAKSFIIKCNPVHYEELLKQAEQWKAGYLGKSEIFIIQSQAIAPGNAVIEKEDGRIEAGIDIAFEKIRETLL